MELIQKLRKKADKSAKELFEVLHEQKMIIKILRFFKHFLKDMKINRANPHFEEYGLTVYCGHQGSGKSISMVERLEQIRRDYPEVMILTNFGYSNQNEALSDWQQLIDVRNGEKGIVFCIDEIQNEFDVYETRNFNLDLLKVVTQQRKQGIKILATSQIFTRVTKPLREQCYEVVECRTIAKRWTFQRCFDADDYNMLIDSVDVEKKQKIARKWRKNFVQSDAIRNKFDSYAVIDSMKKLIDQERGKRRKVA